MTQVATPGRKNKATKTEATRPIQEQMDDLFSQYAKLKGIVDRRMSTAKEETKAEATQMKELEKEILEMAGTVAAAHLFNDESKIVLTDGEVVTKAATVVRESEGFLPWKLLKADPKAGKVAWSVTYLKAIFSSADDRKKYTELGIDLGVDKSLSLAVNK
jgi:hypothetical protein